MCEKRFKTIIVLSQCSFTPSTPSLPPYPQRRLLQSSPQFFFVGGDVLFCCRPQQVTHVDAAAVSNEGEGWREGGREEGREGGKGE